MAERRMVSISLIDDDRFLDMSQGAQFLYFHLTMRADDDGFITPKKVMRLVGASQKDLDALINAGFLISFESGVVVITHWRVNNTIRKDRYTPTSYQKEFNELTVNNGVYERCVRQPMVTEDHEEGRELDNQLTTNGEPSGNQLATKCQPDDNQVADTMATERQPTDNQWLPQVRLGKDREREKTHSLKESSSKRETPSPGNQTATWINPPTLEEVRSYFGGNCLKGNPDDFWSNYAAVGWVDGLGRKITDWKAAARKWSGRENHRASPGGAGGGRPRDYDGSYDGHAMKEVSL